MRKGNGWSWPQPRVGLGWRRWWRGEVVRIEVEKGMVKVAGGRAWWPMELEIEEGGMVVGGERGGRVTVLGGERRKRVRVRV